MREFHLISAPFSSGISWAVSVLIELGIRTTHAEPNRYRNGFWRPVPDQPGFDAIVPEGVAHMRYYLPVLHERNAFRFEPDIEVFWEHRLDFARQIHRPVVLFTRDPRDAVHSLYQRNYRHFAWMEYLKRPDRWPDHFPEMFGLPPAETWAAWHAFWRGLESVTPMKVVRFEDSKLRPLDVAKELLEWLGVQRTDSEIRQAVERSSFSKIHAAMTTTETETGQKFGVARRGKAGEWKEVFDTDALQCFDGPAAHWIHELGYEPAPSSMDTTRLRQLSVADAMTAELQACIDKFHAAWSVGNSREAREQMDVAVSAAASAKTSDDARLAIAAYQVAFSWTERVLGESELGSPTARSAFAAFQRFNTQFAKWPSVRHMLNESSISHASIRNDVFGSLTLNPGSGQTVNPATSVRSTRVGDPVLVQEDYKGYRLVGFAGRFYAIAREATHLDLRQLSNEQLRSCRSQGTVFAGDLGFEVKAAIDQFVRAA